MKKVDVLFRGGGRRRNTTLAAEPLVSEIVVTNAVVDETKADAVVVVEPEPEPEPELPAVELPKVLPNRVKLELFQKTFKEVTVKGEKVKKPVNHFMEFSFETTETIESSKLSDWLIANLAKYQIMQKAQGRAAFDQSLTIEMNISVICSEGEKQVASGIKMSTNAKALARILEQYPTVVSMVFNPQSFGYGTSRADVMKLVNGVNTVIAPAAKQIAVNAEGQLEAAI